MVSAHGEMMSSYRRAAAGGGPIEPGSSCCVFLHNQGVFLSFPFVPRLLETPPRFIRYKNKQTTHFLGFFFFLSSGSFRCLQHPRH